MNNVSLDNMNHQSVKNYSLQILKLGMTVSETEQSIKEFNEAVVSVRRRYSWIGWILYKMGIL